MFRKLALGLVAAASLGAAALAPTAASAKPFGFGGGWGGGWHHHHHFGLGLGYVGVGDDVLREPAGADPVRLPPAPRQRLRTDRTSLLDLKIPVAYAAGIFAVASASQRPCRLKA